jgi:hypothetical protein
MAIQDSYATKTDSTKGKFLGQILRLADEFPPYSNRISKSNKTILRSQFNTWLDSGAASQREENQKTSYFTYDVIKQAIANAWGTESYQYLFISLYTDIIPRDDLNSFIMIDNKKDTIDDEKNYILLDNATGEGTIFLRNYKTSGAYGQIVLSLSAQNIALIKFLHNKETVQPVTKLFPNLPSKLHKWIPSIECMGKIPQFRKPRIGTTYLRHSMISTTLMKINNTPDINKSRQIVLLADKSAHKVAAQSSYISPLKKLDGSEVYEITYIEEANKAIKKIVSNYNTRSKAKASVPVVPVVPAKKVATKNKGKK